MSDDKLEEAAYFLKNAAKQRLKGQTKSKFLTTHKDKRECSICHYNPIFKDELDWHRIIPRGEYTEENTILLCEACHKKIHKLIRNGVEPKIAIFMVSIETIP